MFLFRCCIPARKVRPINDKDINRNPIQSGDGTERHNNLITRNIATNRFRRLASVTHSKDINGSTVNAQQRGSGAGEFASKALQENVLKEGGGHTAEIVHDFATKLWVKTTEKSNEGIYTINDGKLEAQLANSCIIKGEKKERIRSLLVYTQTKRNNETKLKQNKDKEANLGLADQHRLNDNLADLYSLPSIYASNSSLEKQKQFLKNAATYDRLEDGPKQLGKTVDKERAEDVIRKNDQSEIASFERKSCLKSACKEGNSLIEDGREPDVSASQGNDYDFYGNRSSKEENDVFDEYNCQPEIIGFKATVKQTDHSPAQNDNHRVDMYQKGDGAYQQSYEEISNPQSVDNDNSKSATIRQKRGSAYEEKTPKKRNAESGKTPEADAYHFEKIERQSGSGLYYQKSSQLNRAEPDNNNLKTHQDSTFKSEEISGKKLAWEKENGSSDNLKNDQAPSFSNAVRLIKKSERDPTKQGAGSAPDDFSLTVEEMQSRIEKMKKTAKGMRQQTHDFVNIFRQEVKDGETKERDAAKQIASRILLELNHGKAKHRL